MLNYLGRILSARRTPLAVRYLTTAEREPIWREGLLLAIDPQGASFATSENGTIVECLPWGSIASIRIDEDRLHGLGAPDGKSSRLDRKTQGLPRKPDPAE